MKAFLVNLVVIGFLVTTFGTIAHAETLTLDDCITLALQNRASIIAARGAEDLARADKRAALGAFLPRASAYYNYSKRYSRDLKSEATVPADGFVYLDTLTFVDGISGQVVDYEVVRDSVTAWETQEFARQDQDRTSKNWGVQANMSLFDLSNWYDLAAAGAAREKARLDVIASEQDLVLSVKLSYYAYLAVVENVDVQEEAVKRSNEQLKLIESKFDLGSAAKSDVLKQKVLYGNDRLALLSAENAVITAKADLAYTIGIDPNRDVDFATDYTPRIVEGTLDDALQFAYVNQPGLLASEKSADAAGYFLRSARAAYLPTVGANASLGWSDGTAGDTAIFNFSSRETSIGIGVSWTLFDGFWRERQVSASKIARNNARAMASETRNMVAVQIKTAFYDIEKAVEQTKVAMGNVAAATEDLKITQEKYNLGAATILDLLNAQVSLKGAQVQHIRAGFDLNLAVARLDKAMGRTN